MSKKDYTTILTECAKIAKMRQKQYGEATENLDLTVKIMKDTFGVTMTPKDLCLALVALKLSRERTKHKDDNIHDSINYLAIYLSL